MVNSFAVSVVLHRTVQSCTVMNYSVLYCIVRCNHEESATPAKSVNLSIIINRFVISVAVIRETSLSRNVAMPEYNYVREHEYVIDSAGIRDC